MQKYLIKYKLQKKLQTLLSLSFRTLLHLKICFELSTGQFVNYYGCINKLFITWHKARLVRHFWQVVFRIFLCVHVLLKGNFMTFLVQFGIYLHSWVFQKAHIAFTLRAHAILKLSEKPTRANKFQIELEVIQYFLYIFVL